MPLETGRHKKIQEPRSAVRRRSSVGSQSTGKQSAQGPTDSHTGTAERVDLSPAESAHNLNHNRQRIGRAQAIEVD